MDHLKKRLRSRRGFTLAELLIVVAIIAVLIAIAIPVFANQLNESRKRVDEANVRSAESMVSTLYLMHNGSGKITFKIGMDGDTLGVNSIERDNNASIEDEEKIAVSSYIITSGYNQCPTADTTKYPDDSRKESGDSYISVVVENGKVKGTWASTKSSNSPT